MKKSELLEFINKETNGKLVNFKLANVLYNEAENLATFRFIHLYDASEKDRQDLTNLIKKFINSDTKISVKFHKSFFDEDVCVSFIKKYMMKNYPNIYSGFNSKDVLVDIQEDNVNLTLLMPEIFYNFLVMKNFEQELHKALKTQFFNNFSIKLKVKEGVSLDEGLVKWKRKIDRMIDDSIKEGDKKYKVSNLKTFIGKEINNCVTPIKFLKAEMEGTVVAGKLQDLQKRTFMRKDKKTNEEEERSYFNFFLTDETGTVKCVFFPNKASIEKINTLKDGQELAIYGDVDFYNGSISIKVNNISACTLTKIDDEEKILEKTVNEEYFYVKPEKYINVEQKGLFDFEKQSCPFIIENEFVVFDLETTGLRATESEIIEIGAVKVKNGVINETFSSLVKPKNSIPEEATKINGITNEMVENSPTIEQVLPDFFKFVDSSYIVAYNIDFDYSFINVFGSRMGYKFTNKQIDAMAVAKSCLHSIKNYTLKSVVKALDIPLENAHRAINDTIATAKAFIKLGNKAEEFVR